MSAFKALRDVSNHFEYDLRQVSLELFSARIGHKFEETIEKKTKELATFSSKLKLLNAKRIAATPQVLEGTNANALESYGDTAVWKVLEQVTAKSLTQAHAVKALITAPDTSLDAELLQKKEAIIERLIQFRVADGQLQHLNTLLKAKEDEHAVIRDQWDHSVGELRDITESQGRKEVDCRGPLYRKLSALVEKLELMRWFISRLMVARGSYDWLGDPDQRLSLLPLTRQHHNIDLFTSST